jgi:hypothetical protein
MSGDELAQGDHSCDRDLTRCVGLWRILVGQVFRYIDDSVRCLNNPVNEAAGVALVYKIRVGCHGDDRRGDDRVVVADG